MIVSYRLRFSVIPTITYIPWLEPLVGVLAPRRAATPTSYESKEFPAAVQLQLQPAPRPPRTALLRHSDVPTYLLSELYRDRHT